METQSTEMPCLTLQIPPEKIDMFTSLLQTGIMIPTVPGNPIGAFLESLPGFTTEYITDQVQTIFLNGTATDDLETPLDGNNPVLAISAAMPGLAGAIFRKNSLHAALRTTKSPERYTSTGPQVTVRLKLFNAIARDRGAELLRRGVTLNAESLAKFLNTRTTSPTMLKAVVLKGKDISQDELLASLASLDTVHLIIND